jgi:hypothetical protein
MLLNSGHSVATRYCTLVHKLAHLYCGHLGTPNPEWWPDRGCVRQKVEEFEAESVCYLVCKRSGIKSASAEYLASYIRRSPNGDIPQISLDCVMKAAGLIEQMGKGRLKAAKGNAAVNLTCSAIQKSSARRTSSVPGVHSRRVTF